MHRPHISGEYVSYRECSMGLLLGVFSEGTKDEVLSGWREKLSLTTNSSMGERA